LFFQWIIVQSGGKGTIFSFWFRIGDKNDGGEKNIKSCTTAAPPESDSKFSICSKLSFVHVVLLARKYNLFRMQISFVIVSVSHRRSGVFYFPSDAYWRCRDMALPPKNGFQFLHYRHFRIVSDDLIKQKKKQKTKKKE
jgi:hypothetical protein